jgi:hypothetical protein
MQYISKFFVGMALSLSMLGCLAEGGVPSPGGTDDNGGEPSMEIEHRVSPSAPETSDAPDPESSSSTEKGTQPGAAAVVPLGTGFFTTVTDCGSSAWKSPASGTSHAGIQNCSITWGKDITSNPIEFSQTVSFQLRDEETDGKCADASVTGMTGHHSECNGVWVTKTTSLSGHHSSITVTLSWGGNQPVSKTRSAPSGF